MDNVDLATDRHAIELERAISFLRFFGVGNPLPRMRRGNRSCASAGCSWRGSVYWLRECEGGSPWVM